MGRAAQQGQSLSAAIWAFTFTHGSRASMNNSHALPFLAGPAYSEMCERRNKVTGNEGYVDINGCTENWLKEKKKKRDLGNLS